MDLAIFALSALLSAASTSTGSAAQLQPPMDITRIEIRTEEARLDGVLGAQPYGFAISVEGENIQSVSVQTPNSAPTSVPLVDLGDEWSHALLLTFASAADLVTAPTFGYGTFDFTFVDLNGASFTASVTYADPGPVAPHSGFADVTYPAFQQPDVIRNPTLKWAFANEPCGDYGWRVRVDRIGSGQTYEAELPDPLAPGCAPGLLAEHASFMFWVSSVTLIGGATQELQTSGGDEFEYFPGYETPNEVLFSTQDWTDLYQVLSGTHGNPRLTGSGPMSAATSNVLTLTNGLPSALAAFVYGIAQINAPFKGGVMVPLPTHVLFIPLDASGSYSEPYNWPGGIPSDTAFYTQAWIVDPGGLHGFAASNGLRVISR